MSRQRHSNDSVRPSPAPMRIAALLAAVLLVFLTLPASCLALASTGEAFNVSSTLLIEQAQYLDGRPVVYRGEVIGDFMRREGHVWINVSDGSNAIGIWLTEAQAEGLARAGRYDARGDEIEVTGTFSRACPEHGGDYDIHALSITRLAAGYPVDHPVRPELAGAAIIAFLAAMTVLWLYGRASWRHRRPLRPRLQPRSERLLRFRRPADSRRPLP